MKNTERFIENIEITKLHPFEGNPYKVRDDADMESLEESISEQGIAMPCSLMLSSRLSISASSRTLYGLPSKG